MFAKPILPLNNKSVYIITGSFISKLLAIEFWRFILINTDFCYVIKKTSDFIRSFFSLF